MKKILAGIIVGGALIGLSACASTSNVRDHSDGSHHSGASTLHGGHIGGFNGYSKFGHGGFGHGGFGHHGFGHSKFGFNRGFRGRSRFGGRRGFGSFGGRGCRGRGRLGGFRSFRGSRGFRGRGFRR